MPGHSAMPPQSENQRNDTIAVSPVLLGVERANEPQTLEKNEGQNKQVGLTSFCYNELHT